MKISLFLLTAGLAMTGSASNAAPGQSGVEAHIREVHARAMAGDANAQAELGAIYAYGEGVPKDLLRGLIWFDVADASGAPVGETPYMVDYLVGKEQERYAARRAHEIVQEIKKTKRAGAVAPQ